MSDANKTVMRRIAEEVLNGKDLDRAGVLVAPDVVDHSGFPGQPPGLEGIRMRWSSLLNAFPDFHISIDDMIAEGDLVAMRAVGRGHHGGEFLGVPPTGRLVEFREVNISRICDGLMIEHWAERSTLEVMTQIGALAPGSGSATEGAMQVEEERGVREKSC
jgi:predicted ester cyclase